MLEAAARAAAGASGALVPVRKTSVMGCRKHAARFEQYLVL
jgi:hypothetical protein